MRIAMTLLALSLAVGPAACKKKETTTAASGTGETGSAAMGSGSAMGSDMGSAGMAAGSGSGSDMGSAAMAAGSGAGSGSDMGSAAGSGAGSGSAADAATMTHKAGMCPSTVLGATTKSEVKGKDVVLTITADDKDAIVAIQKRTDEMLKARLGAKTPGSTHDQRGTHGGSIGLCPVHIPEGATAKAKTEKKGVVVTITPTEKPEDLKSLIDLRIQKAADWVKANLKEGSDKNLGGVGGGKGNDGMNRSGSGDGKGIERKKGDGKGGGEGKGGGGGKGTGGGSASGSAKP